MRRRGINLPKAGLRPPAWRRWRGAPGVSTKTLYRLIPAKAALFESMVSDRIDRFVSIVNLRDCEGRDTETALQKALMICADLILDPEVLAIYRMMLAEGDAFPGVPETFYRKAMQRTVAALADWLRIRQQSGLIALDDVDEAAGMLLGMMAFEPQRAALYGHQPLPDHAAIAKRAGACAKLFLRGCRTVLAAAISPFCAGSFER